MDHPNHHSVHPGMSVEMHPSPLRAEEEMVVDEEVQPQPQAEEAIVEHNPMAMMAMPPVDDQHPNTVVPAPVTASPIVPSGSAAAQVAAAQLAAAAAAAEATLAVATLPPLSTVLAAPPAPPAAAAAPVAAAAVARAPPPLRTTTTTIATATPQGVASHHSRKGRWTEKEKALFLQGYAQFSNASFRWKKISEFIGTRTPVQCKTHHQKMMGGGKTKRGVDATVPEECPVPEAAQPAEAATTAAASAAGASAGEDTKMGSEGGEQYGLAPDQPEQHDETAVHLSNNNNANMTQPDSLAIGETGGEAGAGGADTGRLKSLLVAGGDLTGMPVLDASLNVSGSAASQETLGTLQPSTIAVYSNGNNESSNTSSGRWSDEEKRLFDLALSRHGRGRWKQISKDIGTRSSIQCKTYYQKVELRLRKEREEKERQMSNYNLAHASEALKRSVAAEDSSVSGQAIAQPAPADGGPILPTDFADPEPLVQLGV